MPLQLEILTWTMTIVVVLGSFIGIGLLLLAIFDDYKDNGW